MDQTNTNTCIHKIITNKLYTEN